MIIGMFHTRKDPNKVSRAYLYNMICNGEGVRFIYFTARGVNFERKTIRGRCYQGGRWVWYECPFPDIFINNVSPKTRFQGKVYNKLKKLIPVTSYSVGDKDEVYRRIEKGEVFKDYLIPYAVMKGPDSVYTFLDEHQKIILKPISGHHGEDLITIQKLDDLYQVQDSYTNNEFTKDKLDNYLDNIKEQMIMQKFINSCRKTGEAYDFRINFQKDDKGKWGITMIYPRIGSNKRIATNLSQGGLTTLFDCFLEDEFEEEHFYIKRYLEVFSLRFGEHFDTLYPHQFDELGLDIGLDENQKIWIYEVNWRPVQ